LREGIPFFRGNDGQGLGRLLDSLDVISAPGPANDNGPKRLDAQRRKRGLDVDITELVLLAFVHGEGDEEAAPVAVEIGGSGNDLHVGIAVLQIELAQQLAIEIEAVGIVDVRALEKTQDIRLGCADHVTKLRVAEGVVADKVDGAHFGARPFIDFVDDIDAIVVEIDDLRRHLGRIHALAAIDVEDPLHVGLDAGARIDAARFRLHFGAQGVVVALFVPFECDLRNDRVLHHDHDDGAALAADADILEKASGKEGFQRFVDLSDVVGIADIEGEVSPNRFGLDAPVALDANCGNRSRRLGVCR
jgi:hypothetical protein